MSYTSKYTGSEIDNLLDKIGDGAKIVELANINDFAKDFTNKSITLSDSIENYDYIEIAFCARTNGNERNFPTKWYNVKTIVESGYGSAIRYFVHEEYLVAGGPYQITGSFHVLNTTTIILEGMVKEGFDECGIGKIYGIKLNAGSSSESNYREQELLSEPKEYTITGGRKWTTLNTTITLNDSISNYDALEFTIDIQKSNGYYHTRHHYFSVSNIIYNNSNDTIYDGSHMLVPFGNMTYNCVLGGWFKTDTVFYLVNIGVWNVAADNIEFPTARIRSIKGIKY